MGARLTLSRAILPLKAASADLRPQSAMKVSSEPNKISAQAWLRSVVL